MLLHRYLAIGDDICCITDINALYTQPMRALLSLITKEVRGWRRPRIVGSS